MMKSKHRAFHGLIIVVILLSTQVVPQSVHAESPGPSAGERNDKQSENFLNVKNDEDNTTDGHERPSVLIRYIHSIDGSSDMGIRMKDDLRKATEHVQGSDREGLILSSTCPMTSKEEYGSSEFGNWMVDPSGFDFVVTHTIEGYTRDSDFFSFNQPIQLTETWEVKKGLDATISKKLRTSFELLIDTGLTFEPEDFQESVPMLLLTIVAPRRGPILNQICSFIQTHST